MVTLRPFVFVNRIIRDETAHKIIYNLNHHRIQPPETKNRATRKLPFSQLKKYREFTPEQG